MKIEKEDIDIDSISELLKNCKVDDGTFLDSLYNLYLFIGITKGVDDIRNGRGMTIEESRERMMKKYASYNTKFGS